MKRTLQVAMAGAMLVFGSARAQTTELVSVSSSGANVSGDAFFVSISGDGRLVAFRSNSSDLVPGDTNGEFDIFVRDRLAGTTQRVSVDSAGAQANDSSGLFQISSDGRFVAFASSATNLVANDTNGASDVFVRDLQTGETRRVSVSSAGAEADSVSSEAAISSDGRFVAFTSAAENLVAGDTNNSDDVFVHDTQTSQTTRVSLNPNGTQANDHCRHGAISADGRFVAFSSHATSLAPPPHYGGQVYMRDRLNGLTLLVSVDSSGEKSHDSSFDPSLSADARYVAFRSQATDLVPDDTNGLNDLFVHDRQDGWTRRVSVDSAGLQASTGAGSFEISADGRYVVFTSADDGLVPNDTSTNDVFVHDLQTGQTTRVSVSSSGAAGDLDSGNDAAISGDGRYVAFDGNATNLDAADSDEFTDIFVRDRGPERITPFCESSIADCPCANVGAEHHGCAGSIYPRGGYLGGYGTPSVTVDSFLLRAQEVSGLTTLFYQGDAQMAPTVLDDGVACVSGSLIRLGVRSNSGGVSNYPEAGDLSVSVRGMLSPLGGTRYYQAWYRNALPFCTPATTNRTNGLVVVWAP